MTLADLRKELEGLHAASLAWALGCCEWNKEEAQDVLQAAYLKVIDGSAVFEERSSLKTWFFSVIHRTASERRRRKWTHIFAVNKIKIETPQASPTHEQPDQLTGEAQVALLVRAAMQELSDRQREIINLVFYHDMTIEEAAHVMKIGLGTARVHYDRGKKELAKLLSQKGVSL